ncbi:hypothetical protein [Mucilaginibacter glaciei]|uniref:Uncharacterized protein n=1 Tax=Mucilaginibacter glaciei TaxID=2772109 RepID=A0A926S2S8_9SPHI|nr:hypothetical protein [Mucilaginibacter glaciei]MBD1394182.1 hypothetical protein [Mucilaginibacter glaciei]
MKLLIKYLIYSLVMVTILIISLNIFRDHPEAQFAFIFPGIFLVVFSKIMDDTVRNIAKHVRHPKFR